MSDKPFDKLKLHFPQMHVIMSHTNYFTKVTFLQLTTFVDFVCFVQMEKDTSIQKHHSVD